MAVTSAELTFRGLPVLEQTPQTLRNLLDGASTEELDWQPAPERWSISMVLAHLADVEVKGFRSRFHAIVEQQSPVLPSYDQLALFASSATFDGRAELDRFDKERAKTLAWLKTLPRGVESRLGNHEELGVLSFEQLLHEFAFHDLGHIRQIAELYRSRVFYPNMGVFQKYYTVHP